MAITKVIEVPDKLPHARLYLDDVDEICQILVQALGEEREPAETEHPSDELKTTFLMNGLCLDSIEDLKEHGGSTTDLTVSVVRGYKEVRLEFSFYGAPRLALYCFKDEKAFATYAKIKAILDRKELKARNLAAQLPDWTAMTLVPIVLVYAPIALVGISRGHRAIVAVLSVGTLAILLYFGVRPTRIYFVPAHEDSKSRRQKIRDYVEKIAILIVGALIGLAISRLFPR